MKFLFLNVDLVGLVSSVLFEGVFPTSEMGIGVKFFYDIAIHPLPFPTSSHISTNNRFTLRLIFLRRSFLSYSHLITCHICSFTLPKFTLHVYQSHPSSPVLLHFRRLLSLHPPLPLPLPLPFFTSLHLTVKT